MTTAAVPSLSLVAFQKPDAGRRMKQADLDVSEIVGRPMSIYLSCLSVCVSADELDAVDVRQVPDGGRRTRVGAQEHPEEPGGEVGLPGVGEGMIHMHSVHR